jgi:hypothetical protein
LLQLTCDDRQERERYHARLNAVAMSAQFGYPPEQARQADAPVQTPVSLLRHYAERRGDWENARTPVLIGLWLEANEVLAAQIEHYVAAPREWARGRPILREWLRADLMIS